MTQKIGLVIVLFIIPLLLLGYFGVQSGGSDFFPSRGAGPGFTSMEVNGIPLNVEIAKTMQARQKGLSGKESLREDQGMLFVFEEPDFHGIWMKDMKFAIDILWLDEGGVIVDIEGSAVPESYPTVFYPSRPAVYVLELPGNFTELRNVRIGDVVELPATLR